MLRCLYHDTIYWVEAIMSGNLRPSQRGQCALKPIRKHSLMSLSYIKLNTPNLLKVLRQHPCCVAQHFACEIPVGAQHVSQCVEITIWKHLEDENRANFRLVKANHIMSQHNGTCRQQRQKNADKHRFFLQLNLQWLPHDFVVNCLEQR